MSTPALDEITRGGPGRDRVGKGVFVMVLALVILAACAAIVVPLSGRAKRARAEKEMSARGCLSIIQKEDPDHITIEGKTYNISSERDAATLATWYCPAPHEETK